MTVKSAVAGDETARYGSGHRSIRPERNLIEPSDKTKGTLR
jgi:hypothetical protein